MKGVKYRFSAKPWRYAGPAAWHFVSLPVKMSNEIRKIFKQEEKGWGRLKATAAIGSSEWKTSIWFDTKKKTYLLPLNAKVRAKEKLTSTQAVKINLWI